MRVKKILFAGLTGTTFMTGFSYLVSMIGNENFSEPERLGQLVHRLSPSLNKKEHQAIGWSAHYGVGLLFAAIYDRLWDKRQVEPSFKNNLLLGGISGLAAVAIWKATFEMHPLPPSLSFNKYYFQLVPAHVVFAIFAGMTYGLLSNPKTKMLESTRLASNSEVEES
ncbi:MAG: hypothetical protein M3N14_05840 [Bacteroidota bacterium]|nr:hypothetical protein [Bacteroidota bacterium]